MPIEKQMQRYIINNEIKQYTVYRAHQQLPWFKKGQKEIIQTLSQLSWRVDTVRVATEDYSNIFSSNVCFEPLSAKHQQNSVWNDYGPKIPKGGR